MQRLLTQAEEVSPRVQVGCLGEIGMGQGRGQGMGKGQVKLAYDSFF